MRRRITSPTGMACGMQGALTPLAGGANAGRAACFAAAVDNDDDDADAGTAATPQGTAPPAAACWIRGRVRVSAPRRGFDIASIVDIGGGAVADDGDVSAAAAGSEERAGGCFRGPLSSVATSFTRLGGSGEPAPPAVVGGASARRGTRSGILQAPQSPRSPSTAGGYHHAATERQLAWPGTYSYSYAHSCCWPACAVFFQIRSDRTIYSRPTLLTLTMGELRSSLML
eukprot:COSAG01_NODE_3354_length_6215_cov_299.344016_2_plen_228_part_00